MSAGLSLVSRLHQKLEAIMAPTLNTQHVALGVTPVSATPSGGFTTPAPGISPLPSSVPQQALSRIGTAIFRPVLSNTMEDPVTSAQLTVGNIIR